MRAGYAGETFPGDLEALASGIIAPVDLAFVSLKRDVPEDGMTWPIGLGTGRYDDATAGNALGDKGTAELASIQGTQPMKMSSEGADVSEGLEVGPANVQGRSPSCARLVVLSR